MKGLTMKHRLTATAVVITSLLGACASAPPLPPPELVSARHAVHDAEMDPIVLSNAPLHLKKATDSLNRADMLFSKGEPIGEINTAAYVAEREAKAAMAIAQAKHNEESIRNAQIERERARADIKSQEARAARGEASVAQQQAAMAEQRANRAQASAIVANANAADAQQQAAMLQRQLDDLQAQNTERGMLVTLGDVLFEFNRADIKPTAQGELHKLADFLLRHPERYVLIEGYTDNVGSADYNTTLSQRRAQAVALQLESMGVSRDRVQSVGYGKSFPVADNTTDTNRALNRRVEVYISNNDQPVPQRG